MASNHSAGGASHGSTKSYMVGFILSVILTVIPFGLVMFQSMSKAAILTIVLVFAVVQVLVHLVCFLHLDRSSEQRWNVIAGIFSFIIIALLVGLSLWIMFSVHHFMLAK
ncbi:MULTISPECIES: cytochrome o ubiquinol oxidase subunit IV [Pseudomonas]|uniref:Cytochrome bo(3) ubiquinol oxidase subunit 4 n=1 Tax=Pseudomonas quercus TaxID=2722792 RepID=A0ABX0YE68_9PSED|nr:MULTISPECIES: cytochrome o ubiquinol oxidase subunit IV [Pseudomonas]MBF7141794.1 cytochrome o ubiquinol oxidase subunit IV [Pseudomonas sp. LY10J]NJP00333.1 cytochrome o ubiquinol oxidase subunit IV [Pseudomonas quercus]